MWGYSIDYNFETGASKSDLDYCGNGSQEPEGPQSCDVLRNNEYDTTTIFKIKNVEDLVCVSEMAKTKSFLEKTIYLIKDIDFNDDSSYENPNNTSYGDINGNGEVEGLKTELTTSAGFYPIGSQTVPFKGTFKGYANSISNLMISRNQNNVGLFGYNQGKISGFNVTSTIIGGSNVGGVVGYNDSGVINEIIFDGSVNSFNGGTTYGGIVGYSDGGEIKSILVKNFETNNETVVCTNAAPAAGKTANGTVITGVVEKGSLYRNNCSGKAVGRDSNGSFTIYVSNLVTATSGPSLQGYGGIGYTLVPPTTITTSDGEIDSLTYYDNIGLLDTVIGGDNDESGYYLQYNNAGDGIIVVKAGNTPTPSPTPDPGTGEPLEGGSVGDNPPTCVLEQVISRSEGIQPVLTCTDDEGAPTIRSQWNVNKNATTNQFSDIGIVKSGTVNGNSKTVRPYWSISDPISVPTPNTCYYFRFGAQDASGNWSYYVTSKCYYGFGRSND